MDQKLRLDSYKRQGNKCSLMYTTTITKSLQISTSAKNHIPSSPYHFTIMFDTPLSIRRHAPVFTSHRVYDMLKEESLTFNHDQAVYVISCMILSNSASPSLNTHLLCAFHIPQTTALHTTFHLAYLTTLNLIETMFPYPISQLTSEQNM